MPSLRIGILGASRNVPFSIVQPIANNSDLASKCEVVGLASRDLTEADAFAKSVGVKKAYSSYDELLSDPNVDAVYNVLPVAMRCEWSVKALQAGKHVLSETPLCNNAYEAVVLQRAAEDARRVLLEGSHPTCHPVSKRVRELMNKGCIGALERIDLELPVGHSLQGKIVCSKSGSLMGLGCHGIAIMRALSGQEPQVVSAQKTLSAEDATIDMTMTVDFKIPSGAEGKMSCSISPDSSKSPTTFTITGSSGMIHVKEWFTGSGKGSNEVVLEQFMDAGEKQVQEVDNPYPKLRDTFYFQLMAFVDEVQAQERTQAIGMPWDYKSESNGPTDAVRNMAVIDSVYRAAGMAPRKTLFAPPAPYDRIGPSKL